MAGGFTAGAQHVGCKLKIIDLGAITTPLTQMAVRELKSAGGVMITASHNPLTDNGFKFLTGIHDPHEGDAPPGALLSADKMALLVGDVRQMAAGGGDFARAFDALAPNDIAASFGEEEDHHHRIRAERAYLDFLGAEWGVEPHCLKPLTHGPALLDPNGGAACGIGARVLEHFGVRTVETNATIGRPEHPIDTDGIDPRTGRHVLLRVAQSAFEVGARFGIAFDYDADRGNMVLPGHDETAIIPPQRVAALSIALALSHRNAAHGRRKTPLAVVMADSTSGAGVEMARLFGARVFVVETGEINVVTRMRQLRNEGFDVPIGVEGANGGAIFGASTCRDGLMTALCMAFADESPDMPNEWIRALRQDFRAPERVSSLRLPDMLSLIPSYRTQMFRLEVAPRPHGEIKSAMESYFTSTLWPEISSIYDSYEFADYEGTLRVEARSGDQSGGWRVNLAAGDQRDFIFARGSRTEAGIWRIITDSPDESRGENLADIGPRMFEHATG